jgi:hypothetical protein
MRTLLTMATSGFEGTAFCVAELCDGALATTIAASSTTATNWMPDRGKQESPANENGWRLSSYKRNLITCWEGKEVAGSWPLQTTREQLEAL